jgi:hypothetical protein
MKRKYTSASAKCSYSISGWSEWVAGTGIEGVALRVSFLFRPCPNLARGKRS